MKVARLKIENFRGIKNASINFDDHNLMVGPNNVGKSTICNALDLVLGPAQLYEALRERSEVAMCAGREGL